MKYIAEIEGHQLSLELDERDTKLRGTVNDRSYELQVLCPEAGVYLIFSGEEVYEARVSSSEPGNFTVRLRDRVFAATIIDRKHRRHGADASEEGLKTLVAPMPGKVVCLLLGVGAPVEAGQGVVVVEAMKMQNEIKSPKSGQVIEVRVREGDTVNANQVLAVVE